MVRLVGIDFETYYDDQYSLTKLTTEEYIHHTNFELQCATATTDGIKYDVAWGESDIRHLIKEYGVNRSDTLTTAHNARFDGAISEWVLGVPINFLVCTILLGRETGIARLGPSSLRAMAQFFIDCGYDIPRKGDAVERAKGIRLTSMTPEFRRQYELYCGDDTLGTHRIARIMMPLTTPLALRSMNMFLRMFTRPVFQINVPLLEAYKQKLAAKREESLAEMAKTYGHDSVESFHKVLRSAPKFSAVLEGLGVEVPMKISEKKTETARKLNPKAPVVYTPALSKKDPAFLELREHYDDRVVALVEAKLENNSSIAESRAQSFIELGRRGALAIPIEYGKAHTNRGGGSDKVNVQNLPKRGQDTTLRESIIAPPGCLIGGADSSQIEARLVAFEAGEQWMLDTFGSGDDVYAHVASDIYGTPIETIKYYNKVVDIKGLPPDHPEVKNYFTYVTTQRGVGKQTVLGANYQMGGDRFGDYLLENKVKLLPDAQQFNDWRMRECPAGLGVEEVKRRTNIFKKEFHKEEAARVIKVYRGKISNIVNFWYRCHDILQQMIGGGSGYFGGPNDDLFFYDGMHTTMGVRTPGIKLPDGFWIIYPGLREQTDEVRDIVDPEVVSYEKRLVFDKWVGKGFATWNIYGGKVVENITQALAFAILKYQASFVDPIVPVKYNAHDQWVSVFPERFEPAVKKLYIESMRKLPPWIPPGLPLDCEWKSGKNYAEAS